MSAHVRLGAQNGMATVLFGGLLVAVGWGFGPAILPWLQMIPVAVFGALLVLVGWAHAALARDVIGDWGQTAVVVGVAIVGVATQNLMLRLVAGWCVLAVQVLFRDVLTY
jgi:MFS superfamily sulfate permease-like transporter